MLPHACADVMFALTNPSQLALEVHVVSVVMLMMLRWTHVRLRVIHVVSVVRLMMVSWTWFKVANAGLPLRRCLLGLSLYHDCA